MVVLGDAMIGAYTQHLVDERSNKALSPRQADLVYAVWAFLRDHHRRPTTRELAKQLNLTSTNSVAGLQLATARKGWLVRFDNGYVLTTKALKELGCPFCASVKK